MSIPKQTHPPPPCRHTHTHRPFSLLSRSPTDVYRLSKPTEFTGPSSRLTPFLFVPLAFACLLSHGAGVRRGKKRRQDGAGGLTAGTSSRAHARSEDHPASKPAPFPAAASSSFSFPLHPGLAPRSHAPAPRLVYPLLSSHHVMMMGFDPPVTQWSLLRLPRPVF